MLDDFIHMIVAVLLFLAAMEICFIGHRNICDTVTRKQLQYSDVVLYEKPVSDRGFVVKGEMVLTMLCKPALTDIQICCPGEREIIVKAGSIGIEGLQEGEDLSDAVYRMQYIYDNRGGYAAIKFVEIKAGGG